MAMRTFTDEGKTRRQLPVKPENTSPGIYPRPLLKHVCNCCCDYRLPLGVVGGALLRLLRVSLRLLSSVGLRLLGVGLGPFGGFGGEPELDGQVTALDGRVECAPPHAPALMMRPSRLPVCGPTGALQSVTCGQGCYKGGVSGRTSRLPACGPTLCATAPRVRG
eukprot:1185916-Prorocentrum_minimum.AAC.3